MNCVKPIEYITICPKCGAKLRFVMDDIRFSDMPFDRKGAITCPNCQEEIETHSYCIYERRYELHRHIVQVIYEGEEKE